MKRSSFLRIPRGASSLLASIFSIPSKRSRSRRTGGLAIFYIYV
jgi:hypothetical protein